MVGDLGVVQCQGGCGWFGISQLGSSEVLPGVPRWWRAMGGLGVVECHGWWRIVGHFLVRGLRSPALSATVVRDGW